MKLIQGYTIGNRYKILKKIGHGGMAIVYKAYDNKLSRYVAVKIMRYDFADDNNFQKRFSREIKAAAILQHPNIVALYDIGKIEQDGLIIPYLVMEYLDGITLRQYLKNNKILNMGFAIYIIRHILLALDYSHNAYIVHRDIKPANIMITRNNKIKLMDFGIAAPLLESTSRLTKTSMVLGTVHYIPPENIVSRETNNLGDIYSVGCLFYELLTFSVPFTGSTPVSIAYKHINTEAIPPSKVNTKLPQDIDKIVLKGLCKKTKDRYQSAREMLLSIEAFEKNTDTDIQYSIENMSRENDSDTTLSNKVDEIEGIESEKTKVQDKTGYVKNVKKKHQHSGNSIELMLLARHQNTLLELVS